MPRKKITRTATPDATGTFEPSSQQLANLRSQTFLTSAEASLYLRVSRRTLERWSARGTVNPIKLSSSKYVFRRESLDALVDARECAS
jgi:excisionase family DNA binding protein